MSSFFCVEFVLKLATSYGGGTGWLVLDGLSFH